MFAAEKRARATVSLDSTRAGRQHPDGDRHEVGRRERSVTLTFVWRVNGVIKQTTNSSTA